MEVADMTLLAYDKGMETIAILEVDTSATALPTNLITRLDKGDIGYYYNVELIQFPADLSQGRFK
jgi:hypothetical protein